METQTQSARDGGGNNRQTAVAVMDEPEKPHMLPVWFFIGAILIVYGILICATGLYELGRPPSTVLASLHAPIWWGVVLAIAGGIFFRKFYPRARQCLACCFVGQRERRYSGKARSGSGPSDHLSDIIHYRYITNFIYLEIIYPRPS